MPFADAAAGGYRNIFAPEEPDEKNLLRILMPALIAGMALMSALTVQASARYGSFIFPHLQQGIANASAQRANRINAYHTNTTDIPAALLVRMSRHIAPGHFGLGAATRIRAAADGCADIRAGASAGADMRIKAADVQHSRPDRSVDRNLEDFVATLSGIEAVLLVLAIVLPVSVATPLLAVLLLGRRCEPLRPPARHARHGAQPPRRHGRHQERTTRIQICRHPHLPPLRPYRLPRADPQLTRPTYPHTGTFPPITIHNT
ncbi:MAG: hypothetical protein L6V80_04145 [Bacteroidales bacterium]|nr:MAG: hypothetical protein L6V80_04145 [Bacteroidales bacterium]